MSRLVAVGVAVAFVVAATALLLFVRVRDLTSAGSPLSAGATDAADAARPETGIGVVSRLAPSAIYEGYQPILDYLGKVTPYRYRLRPGRGYRETVEDLVSGRTQAAFLGSLLYVEAHAAHGVTPLVCPRNARGEPWFESLVVVRADSPVQSLGDLAGRTVAVPPPDSLSANWLRAAATGGVPFTSRSFAHHQAVVHEVLRGDCDAGVVKDRVAAGYLGRGLRVVARSGPVPGSPLVVARGVDRAFAEALAGALLRLDPAREEDRRVLSGWDPEFAWGFAAVSDTDYDPVRALGVPREEPP